MYGDECGARIEWTFKGWVTGESQVLGEGWVCKLCGCADEVWVLCAKYKI